MSNSLTKRNTVARPSNQGRILKSPAPKQDDAMHDTAAAMDELERRAGMPFEQLVKSGRLHRPDAIASDGRRLVPVISLQSIQAGGAR